MFAFNYQKQQQDSWCGAACLSMVFSYFGIKKDQKTIMHEIFDNNASNSFLYVYQIPKYIEANGLQSCGVKGIDAISFIDWCIENDIVLIMSHKI